MLRPVCARVGKDTRNKWTQTFVFSVNANKDWLRCFLRRNGRCNEAGISVVIVVASALQGTLYPDVIESCPPPGSGQKHSHTIKSHHNVGGLPKDLDFTLIEPLRELFKVCLLPRTANAGAMLMLL